MSSIRSVHSCHKFSLCAAIALATLFASTGASSTARIPALPRALKAGDASPPLAFASTLQAPAADKVSLTRLRDKVVLEFWATWCGPCVVQIPHLNALADAFHGRVQFISIDDESPAVVQRFLVRQPIHSWLAFDPTKRVFARYGVRVRPTTIVVGRGGRVVLMGVPEDVTPAVLKAALREIIGRQAEGDGRNLGRPHRPCARIGRAGRALVDLHQGCTR